MHGLPHLLDGRDAGVGQDGPTEQAKPNLSDGASSLRLVIDVEHEGILHPELSSSGPSCAAHVMLQPPQAQVLQAEHCACQWRALQKWLLNTGFASSTQRKPAGIAGNPAGADAGR